MSHAMTDIPEDVQQAATRIADKYLGFEISCQALYADVRAAIIADRAAQAERMARLEEALRRADCPRPCNGRPDDFEVGQCVDAGECGCCLGDPLMKPADVSARALSQEGSEPS